MKMFSKLFLILTIVLSSLVVPETAIAGGGHGCGGFQMRISVGFRGCGGCRRKQMCRSNCFGGQFARRQVAAVQVKKISITQVKQISITQVQAGFTIAGIQTGRGPIPAPMPRARMF